MEELTEEEKMQVELNSYIEDEMVTKIEVLEKELEEKEERYKRLYAEFDNYKKRTEKEKLNVVTYAKSDIVETLLPVIDSMENALQTSIEDENTRQGIELIYSQLKTFMEKHGVEEIGEEGEDFNPELHDAVALQEGSEPGKIINVFRKGYKIKDKILRHAMVIVAK